MHNGTERRASGAGRVGRRRGLGNSALLAGLAAACIACGPGIGTARQVIDPFLEAVQQEDLHELYCSMAGVAGSTDLGVDEATRRSSFEAWARSQYQAYEEGRDSGWVELDGHGITAVKLFSLGRGTYFEIDRLRLASDETMRVRTELRFGYAAIDLSRFSPGTTFYVCGVPPGRVHAIRKPAGPAEESAEVLERLSLEWTLVRRPAADGCPAGWTVASVVPVEGDWSSKRIAWDF